MVGGGVREGGEGGIHSSPLKDVTLVITMTIVGGGGGGGGRINKLVFIEIYRNEDSVRQILGVILLKRDDIKIGAKVENVQEEFQRLCNDMLMRDAW